MNCGIYVFSVRVFSEYGMNSYSDDVDPDGDGFFSDGANTPKENQYSTTSGSDILKLLTTTH